MNNIFLRVSILFPKGQCIFSESLIGLYHLNSIFYLHEVLSLCVQPKPVEDLRPQFALFRIHRAYEQESGRVSY